MPFKANVRAPSSKGRYSGDKGWALWPDDGYLILRMAYLESDQAEPEKVESMPRNNPAGKPN